jgi:alpha-soluble NSF attachment protein
MSQEAKAYDLMAQAEKKFTSRSFFGNSSTKFEDAADLYTKAANIFKMCKKWDDASKAFARAAECHIKLQSKHEAANDFINGANCMKKTNVQEAIKFYQQGVELFCDEGRFAMAAKHQKEVAELYEAEMDLESAMSHYQIAADYFEGENSTSSANQCLLKVAHFAAQLEKYDKAIELFEQVANSSLDSNLLKWSVKEYFLKAGLCHLATGDFVGSGRAIERYKELDLSFVQQRECRFLDDIQHACEEHDVEKFTNVVAEYDSISKLDAWKTTILLRIKNLIKSEDPTI